MSTYRKEMGLSVTRLSQLLKVSRSLVTLYEQGKRNLPARASLIETRIMLLWQKIAAAAPKISPELEPILQQQEQQVDRALQRELVAAEKKWSELSRQIERLTEAYPMELRRFGLLETLSDWPEMKEYQRALNQSKLKQQRSLQTCGAARLRWLHYCMELARAQKQLALKWGMKPVAEAIHHQEKGRLLPVKKTRGQKVAENK